LIVEKWRKWGSDEVYTKLKNEVAAARRLREKYAEVT